MPLAKRPEAQTEPIPASVAPATQPAVGTKLTEAPAKAVNEKPMTRADWDAKDRRIWRAGLWQAAVQSVGVLQFGGRDLNEYLAQVRRVADEGEKYIHE